VTSIGKSSKAAENQIAEANDTRAALWRQAPTGDPCPRCFTLALPEEQYRALQDAAIEDRIGASERLRTLVALWMESGALREQVLERLRS
jgi:hypothetical protein